MKTIESKIIALLLCCVIVCTALVGGIAISFSQEVVDTDAQQILTLLCDKYAGELDALMGRIEQSVDTLALDARDRLESTQRLSDPDYLEQYTNQIQDTALAAVYSTSGALSVYVRYNPELAPPTSGLYWGREGEDSELRELEKTDLALYDPSDEEAEWYYIPVGRGEPAWISPYLDSQPNKLIISYVVPVYKDDVLVGIVGMDIDCEVLERLVKEITIYESGHAFLLDTVKGLIYHPQHGTEGWTEGISADLLAAISERETSGLATYKQEGTPAHMTFRELRNGMHLVVCTPAREINAQRNALIVQIVAAVVLAVLVVLFITVFFTRRTMAPLKKLSEAAYKVAGGTLDVTLPPPTEDEVGTLSVAFREMLLHLKWHEGHMQALAYKDALTGVKNKAAWDDATGRLMREMENGSPVYAVAVFDVNDLKKINDTQGHEAGNELLKNACAAICRCYAHSPVFRIGGDEFAAILERQDYENRVEILERFRAEMSAPDASVRVASGMSEYIPGTDREFSDVFRRADEAMYENKSIMKAGRT